MIVTTSKSVKGLPVVEYLGVVRGLGVSVPKSGPDQALGAALGGKKPAYPEMYAELSEAACGQAYQRMVKHARELGADAIIAMRYDVTAMGLCTQFLAYGTAVKLGYPEVQPIQGTRKGTA